MGQTPLLQVAVFRYFLDIIRDVGAEVITTASQFADGHFGKTDVVEDKRLNVVNILNAQTIRLDLHDVEGPPTLSLNQLK
jgi:hypothetical protein